MVAVPTATPVTTPEAFIDAIAGSLLLHTPPDTESLKAVVDVTQNESAPVILPTYGNGLTVNTTVAAQPSEKSV